MRESSKEDRGEVGEIVARRRTECLTLLPRETAKEAPIGMHVMHGVT